MRAAAAFCCVGLFWPSAGFPKQSGLSERAKVVDAYGTVQKRQTASATWRNVSVGDLLTANTTLRTGDNSAILLMLPNRHMLRVGAKTTVELKALGRENAFSFNVIAGKIWSLVRPAAKPAKYEVETPSAVVGVSGTIFSVFHDEESAETQVSADEGMVRVRQEGQLINIAKGSFGRFPHHGHPRPRAKPLTELVAPQPDTFRRMWRLMRRQEPWISGAHKIQMHRQWDRQMNQLGFHRHPQARLLHPTPGSHRTGPPNRVAPRPRRGRPTGN